MTSTDILRYSIVIVSISLIVFMITKMVKCKATRNILILPLTVVLNICIRIISLLFVLPLEGVEITIYNNWNSIIIIQTLLMVFFMTLYASQKEK